MDLDAIREETLELIEDYNRDEFRRKLKPIKNYGLPLDEIRLYLSHWSDDNHSTHQIGFMYIEKELYPSGSKEGIPLENAIDNFKKQLQKIPPK